MAKDQSSITLTNNPERKRFEASLDGYQGRVEYMLVQDRIIYTHTEVDPALEEKGVGSLLVRYALEYARQEGLKIMPLCPFVAGYMKRHTEYNDLLMPGFNLG